MALRRLSSPASGCLAKFGKKRFRRVPWEGDFGRVGWFWHIFDGLAEFIERFTPLKTNMSPKK